jgi:hypothetical protein
MKRFLVMRSTSMPIVLGVVVFFHAASAAAVPVVIGPGVQSLIYETRNIDYHVLDGTQITSLSLSGPPNTFVVPTDAIEFRGGGHIQIDGGNYRGGNATYSGSSISATTVAADALHLRQSSGEVFAGTFIGGNAISQGAGITLGGNGLILVESSIVIRGGYFEGGTAAVRGIARDQEPSIIAYDGSFIDMFGGTVAGEIVLYGSFLSIHGTDLAFDGSILSGKYLDGTAFRHKVRASQAAVRFNVPEPGFVPIFAVVGYLMMHCRYRKSGI